MVRRERDKEREREKDGTERERDKGREKVRRTERQMLEWTGANLTDVLGIRSNHSHILVCQEIEELTQELKRKTENQANERAESRYIVANVLITITFTLLPSLTFFYLSRSSSLAPFI